MWINRLLGLYYIGYFITLAFGESCDTPKGLPGTCIPMTNCPELFQILKKKPISQIEILYLQESTCDVSGTQPRVCCPLEVSSEEDDLNPSHQSSKIPSRPSPNSATSDLISHKNYNLLPNVSECGRSILTDQLVSDRIVGGEDAGMGSYPWMALLGAAVGDETPQFHCGGTLINSRYVLTAAHCVNLPHGYKVKTVRLGEYDQTTKSDCESTAPGKKICAPPTQDILVEEVIPHENYDLKKSKEHDIALLRLKYHVAFGPYVAPVCIPRGEKLRSTAGPETHGAFVAGWGRTAFDNPSNAPVLQVVKLKLVSMNSCNKFYANKGIFSDQVDNGRFCAGGDKGMDSCKGDSGGPLMMPMKPKVLGNAIRIFQLGVVSLGPSRCGHEGQPALYTKVPQYIKWIYDNIRP